MADIYRKSALEKLSSPEQLDRMIVITPLSFWLAMIGAGAVILVALIWSIVGRLPVTVNGNGIYINDAGVNVVYADTAGVIASVEVQPGDTIQQGQTVATVTNPDAQAQMNLINERLQQINHVTLFSTNDAVTADTKNLIEIKNSLESAGFSVQQNNVSLEMQQQQYAEEKALLDSLAAQMEQAKSAYYSALDKSNSGSTEQLNYQKAQETVSAQAAKLSEAQQAAASLQQSYQECVAQLEQLYAQLESQAAAGVQPPASSVPTAPSTDDIKAQIAQLEAQKAELETNIAAANAAVSEAQTEHQNALTALENAEKTYRDSLTTNANAQTDLQKKQIEYTEATSRYSAQQSIVSSLEQNIAASQAQMAAEKTNVNQQVETLMKQFNDTKQALISSVETEKKQAEETLSRTQIQAQQSGTVMETMVEVGTVVGQGSELIRLAADESGEGNVVVCYVPLSSGKKLTPGMQVMVYPTTVNKQEYGHMEAAVVHVDDYVTSTTQMKKMLGDDLLVNSFTQDGPVIAVTCTLKEDPSTASGYFWSSKKGADIMLAEGTLIKADIVTERKAPIQMVIPLLKEFFSMNKDKE